MNKRTLTFALAGCAAIGSLIATTGPAHASTTGRCYADDECYYYNSDHAGAVGPAGGGVEDLAGIVFAADTGAGSGLPIKNNAASAENDTSEYFFSFYNSDWQGAYDVIPPMSWANLKATYNEDASDCINTTESRPSVYTCEYLG